MTFAFWQSVKRRYRNAWHLPFCFAFKHIWHKVFMGFPSIFRVNKGNCLQYPSALPYLVCFQTGLVFHGFPFSCRIMIHHDPWWYMIHDDPSAANTIRNHPATPNNIFFRGYISGKHTQKCKTAHYYCCIFIYSFSHQPVAAATNQLPLPQTSRFLQEEELPDDDDDEAFGGSAWSAGFVDTLRCQTWLENLYKCRFIAGKIIHKWLYKWCIFNCNVWLPEGMCLADEEWQYNISLFEK